MKCFVSSLPLKQSPILKKLLKYSLRTLGVIFALLVLGFLMLAAYIRWNKKELIQKTITEIATHTGGHVTLNDLSVSFFANFPYFSLELKNLTITDSAFRRHGHTFFSAEKLFARINPLPLLLGEISLNKLQMDHGGFYLYTDKQGYTNSYLLVDKTGHVQEETAGKPALQQVFSHITIKDFAVTIEDLQHDKLFAFNVNQLEASTKTTDTSYAVQLKESIHVSNMAFIKHVGSYLSNQMFEGNYLLNYNPVAQRLSYQQITLVLSGHPFQFTGAITFGKTQTFLLDIVSKQVSVALVKNLLTAPLAKAISIVTVPKPLDVNAHIIGSLEGGDPYVHINFVTRHNDLATPLLNFTDCGFTGSYINEVVAGKARNDSNSKVEVHQFSGTYQGLVMTSNSILIDNLTTPTVSGDLHSSFPLTQLNNFFPSDAISFGAGTGWLELNYRGPVDHITAKNASVYGALMIQQGTLAFAGPASAITNCRARLRFFNEDIIVDSLLGILGGNPIKMWGTAKNTLSLLGDSKDAVSLNWNVFAPVLNIDHINGLLTRTATTKKTPSGSKTNGLAKTARQLDELLSSGNITAHVRADKLVYQRFTGNSLQADLLINGNAWVLQKASLKHGTGSVQVAAKINSGTGGAYFMDSELHLKNVDAENIWYAFNDFGMKDIGYKNIAGVLNLNTSIAANLNKSGQVDENSITGNADFSILNGTLINFAPVMKIRDFMFKDRDFSNIRFAEIKDHLHFSKGAVNIDRMEIKSNVLSLFVEGVYGITGKTDISIQVPLSNLKKRDANMVPENTGGNSAGGMSVFLRAKTADDGTIKIKYDPFKRFRKK